jgi:hypothetical protein
MNKPIKPGASDKTAVSALSCSQICGIFSSYFLRSSFERKLADGPGETSFTRRNGLPRRIKGWCVCPIGEPTRRMRLVDQKAWAVTLQPADLLVRGWLGKLHVP